MEGLDLKAAVIASSFCAVPYPKLDSTSTAQEFYTSMVWFINTYKSYPQIWGWMLLDEPKYINLFGFNNPEDIEPLRGEQDIAESFDAYNTLSPCKISFFNLACTVGADVIGSEIVSDPQKDTILKQYYAYLSKINSAYRPAMWSFDIYPVKENLTTQELEVRSDYYAYLEAFKAIANLSARPFWAYILSTQHKIYNDDGSAVLTRYPMPTEGTLRFQAFTALAYGGQGILYWTYGQTSDKLNDNETKKEAYYSAPVNRQNQITSIWYAAKNVNQEIKDMNNVFFGAKCVSVVHVYDPTTMAAISNGGSPSGVFGCTTTMTKAFQCLTQVSVPNNGKGVMISHMTKNNAKFLVFVSHDPVNSQMVTASISNSYNWNFFEAPVSPEDPSQNYSVHEVKEGLNPGTGVAQVVTFTLAPGGYRVLYFSPK